MLEDARRRAEERRHDQLDDGPHRRPRLPRLRHRQGGARALDQDGRPGPRAEDPRQRHLRRLDHDQRAGVRRRAARADGPDGDQDAAGAGRRARGHRGRRALPRHERRSVRHRQAARGRRRHPAAHPRPRVPRRAPRSAGDRSPPRPRTPSRRTPASTGPRRAPGGSPRASTGSRCRCRWTACGRSTSTSIETDDGLDPGRRRLGDPRSRATCWSAACATRLRLRRHPPLPRHPRPPRPLHAGAVLGHEYGADVALGLGEKPALDLLNDPPTSRQPVRRRPAHGRRPRARRQLGGRRRRRAARTRDVGATPTPGSTGDHADRGRRPHARRRAHPGPHAGSLRLRRPGRRAAVRRRPRAADDHPVDRLHGAAARRPARRLHGLADQGARAARPHRPAGARPGRAVVARPRRRAAGPPRAAARLSLGGARRRSADRARRRPGAAVDPPRPRLSPTLDVFSQGMASMETKAHLELLVARGRASATGAPTGCGSTPLTA